ncbi:thioredoxin domain-containing protein [Novosphingobium sp. FSY-8]|uniref:Thioredoxin domain-containing protein n=1 Tax=Novosphingobium ovatum TaxID=1908523 RepID=A0ABW9XEL2_9SPHN|nr:thioredoxin domain-containing protein [Novosphingobium ovatum]NBC36985.1 thioredoxin domain-containing protein [Novosphingobium ovatum]
MTQPTPVARPLWQVGLVGLVGGVVGAALLQAVPLPLPRAGADQAVRDYILSHPEILPEAVDKLRNAEADKAIAAVRPEVEKAFPGAVLGNPQGKQVLVEFMDFACGYCRKSEEDVARLIAANPQLKVVLRQLPILSPESTDAAKWALAAAEQGKYAAFHHAMYQAGRPDAAGIAAAAKVAGLDITRAQATIARPDIQAEIERNLDLARKLGLNGTPSWIIGGAVLGGAVGHDELAKAIAAQKQ